MNITQDLLNRTSGKVCVMTGLSLDSYPTLVTENKSPSQTSGGYYDPLLHEVYVDPTWEHREFVLWEEVAHCVITRNVDPVASDDLLNHTFNEMLAYMVRKRALDLPEFEGFGYLAKLEEKVRQEYSSNVTDVQTVMRKLGHEFDSFYFAILHDGIYMGRFDPAIMEQMVSPRDKLLPAENLDDLSAAFMGYSLGEMLSVHTGDEREFKATFEITTDVMKRAPFTGKVVYYRVLKNFKSKSPS